MAGMIDIKEMMEQLSKEIGLETKSGDYTLPEGDEGSVSLIRKGKILFIPVAMPILTVNYHLSRRSVQLTVWDGSCKRNRYKVS